MPERSWSLPSGFSVRTPLVVTGVFFFGRLVSPTYSGWLNPEHGGSRITWKKCEISSITFTSLRLLGKRRHLFRSARWMRLSVAITWPAYYPSDSSCNISRLVMTSFLRCPSFHIYEALNTSSTKKHAGLLRDPFLYSF